jgi:dihydrolipoamide dehydrogenase
MTSMTCDAAIIGAGTAGLAAERAARQAGAKTLLIDDRFAGTTCATVGCMPSKLLIAAANAAHNVNRAYTFGLRATTSGVDGHAVMTRVRKERDAFVAATLKTIEELPPGICVQQRARFLKETTLALGDGRTVSAKAVVVATGARPSVPEMFKGLGELVLTNETVFELASLPRSIAVIGAGPVGLELAQAFAGLGIDVQVFEQTDRIAALQDAEVAKELKSLLGGQLRMHFNVRLEVAASGHLAQITWSGASSGAKSFERVLVATGRTPTLRDLNLAATGIPLDDRGIPQVNDTTLQCGDAPIFLAGDVDGCRPVLHEAAFEGFVAGRNAATFPNVRRSKRAVPLSIMFTDPPLAVVGPPPTDKTIIGTASYTDQGRAKIEASNVGLVRVYAHPGTGALSGAVLFGPGMDHIAHLFAWAIERGEMAGKMLALAFYHPTIEEGLKPALRQICRAVKAPELEILADLAPLGCSNKSDGRSI